MNAPVIQRHCPVCQHTEAAPLWEKGDLRLVSCRRCSMVYASPVPEALVSGAYYDGVGADFYLSPAKLAGDYAESRFKRELRLFRAHCRRGNVLDVGCSSGAFLFHLHRLFPHDYQILGTDVSGPPLDYAESRGVPVRRGDFLAGGLCEASLDAITFWAVLEHLDRPREFVAKAASLLKPGGLCFILVPNFGSLALRLLGARYRYVYPQHLNYFSRGALLRMVEPWFDLVAVRTTHFNPVVIWQDWRSGGRDVSNRERATLLKQTTACKQDPWLAPARVAYELAEGCLTRLGLADNLAVVLRRRLASPDAS